MAYIGKYAAPSAPKATGCLWIRIACILLVLVMLSTHMMSGLYARYTATGSGEDHARVAAFQVIVNGAPADAIAIDCFGDGYGNYTVTVENRSEVAIRYDIIVQLHTLVDGLDPDAVTLDGKTHGSISADRMTLTFPEAGTLAMGTPAPSADHALRFAIDWSDFTKNAVGNEHSASFSFTVTINIVQVD